MYRPDHDQTWGTATHFCLATLTNRNCSEGTCGAARHVSGMPSLPCYMYGASL